MELREEITTKNWEVGTTATILDLIHKKDVNIAIYDRDINPLRKEIDKLIEQHIELRISGDIDAILCSISEKIDPNEFNLITKDIQELLQLFQTVSEAHSFRFYLATVNDNMCRRFHTDLNDLRMLCTYEGPGTLWLQDDNIDRTALNSCGDNECIVRDENSIQQAKIGSVLLLKGALYPEEGTKAVVHRSPTIEESGETRLLLRIDTNEFLNF